MVKNSDIKRREIYRLNQKKLKLLGVLKQEQNEMIYAINECALAELEHYNKLKSSVIEMKMRSAVKNYTRTYMEIKVLEKDIVEVEHWDIINE